MTTAASRFEGSYLGDATRIGAATRMECKICWHVYDPAEGCEHWQIPPGTGFAALPDHWRCPVCDGARDQFMALDGERVTAEAAATAAVPLAENAGRAGGPRAGGGAPPGRGYFFSGTTSRITHTFEPRGGIRSVLASYVSWASSLLIGAGISSVEYGKLEMLMTSPELAP